MIKCFFFLINRGVKAKLSSTAFYDPLEKVEDIGAFEHFDPGHRADPKLPNLLKNATKVWDLHPCGTEVHGVQLSQLDSAGLDELALLAAQRGALVFRDQDFVNIGFEAQKRLSAILVLCIFTAGPLILPRDQGSI